MWERRSFAKRSTSTRLRAAWKKFQEGGKGSLLSPRPRPPTSLRSWHSLFWNNYQLELFSQPSTCRFITSSMAPGYRCGSRNFSPSVIWRTFPRELSNSYRPKIWFIHDRIIEIPLCARLEATVVESSQRCGGTSGTSKEMQHWASSIYFLRDRPWALKSAVQHSMFTYMAATWRIFELFMKHLLDYLPKRPTANSVIPGTWIVQFAFFFHKNIDSSGKLKLSNYSDSYASTWHLYICSRKRTWNTRPCKGHAINTSGRPYFWFMLEYIYWHAACILTAIFF